MKPSRLSSSLFLLSILFYWFPPSIQLLARGRFLKQARFVIDVLHQLSATPLQIYNVSNSIDCTLKCIEHDQCLSFNMAVNTTGGFKLCQLLPTDKYESSIEFKPSSEFNYHHINVGLERGVLNPCRNGGTLILLYWTGNFQCACSAIYIGNYCEWIKLNRNPVHLEAKDNKFGPFNAIQSGQILKFKLVYISEGMSCWITEPGYEITKFGCGPNLAVLITSTSNNIISPNPSYVTRYMNYNLPGVASNDTEIILPEIHPPLHVKAAQEFRLWYGEDLTDQPEHDNVGTLDLDVYAFYA